MLSSYISRVKVPALNFKVKVLLSCLFVLASVAIPQLVHVTGQFFGVGSIVGEIFLPMQFFVIVAGFLAGSVLGGVVGAIVPLISFALTGMPSAVMLPYMIIELCAYGVIAGMLSHKKLPCILSVLIVQVSGRLIKMLAIVVGSTFFYSDLTQEIVIDGLAVGFIGIVIQLVLIPVLLDHVGKK